MLKQENLDNYFQKMWTDYCAMNPHAKSVYDTLVKAGENVVNDHIAFRTFSIDNINKEMFAQHFLKYGYKLCGEYVFTDKKLTAKHFEHSNENMPKVFISQIELSLLSDDAQKIIRNAVKSVGDFNTTSEDFVFSGRKWAATYENFKKLYAESEYAAWVYAHGFRPNHFTVFINYLTKLNDIQSLNSFLKENGFKLNSSGGEIKGTAEQLLEQSSTMAGEILVQFSDGQHKIPSCYYEFAKRYALANGKLFQGFIEKSADKIFESTNQL